MIFCSGLEEFEEKIDKIAEGDNNDEDNWITKIYNKFRGFNSVDNELTDEDMDGIEPPMLDETWGLGQRIMNATSKDHLFSMYRVTSHYRPCR